jgi:hypothetical protein
MRKQDEAHEVTVEKKGVQLAGYLPVLVAAVVAEQQHWQMRRQEALGVTRVLVE